MARTTKSTMTSGTEILSYLSEVPYVAPIEVCETSVAVIATDEPATAELRRHWEHAVTIIARRRGLRVTFGPVVARIRL